eukprot:CAMPEP_0194212004 /NCGR_PEP_ID=MMETSP0156-20130528/11501_1 /TAXON_ID=33649 /ORGANISM="Thalassionema nitzschioides, Strain L26-B" /LENGTH=179 /DNA_ID=CAMNT_0038939709 /DNA_START=97 /DNA_END=636 /DNA_ORIENTATION=+
MPTSEVKQVRESSFTDAVMNCKDSLNTINGVSSTEIELLDSSSPPKSNNSSTTAELSKPQDDSAASSDKVNIERGTGNHQSIKRGSVTLSQISGLGDLVEFDNSDFDDSDDDDDGDNPWGEKATKGRTGSTVGGPNHRPLVGGFAAAAYEAARSHHYSNMNIKTKNPVKKPSRNDPRMA